MLRNGLKNGNRITSALTRVEGKNFRDRRNYEKSRD